MQQPRLGFLASYRGSNMQAIIDACHSGVLKAEPVVVISNNDSGALVRAAKAGIPGLHLGASNYPDPASLDSAISTALSEYNVDLVILAGYMKKLGPETLRTFRGRVLNIHPSLLPKFGGRGMYGKHVHAAVIQAGEKESGVTVHLVDGEYDTGPILAQRKVKVEDNDDADSLARRVLELEHEIYVDTLSRIFDGEIKLPGTGQVLK